MCGALDPAAADNKAIRSASITGHVAVVERLLADPRVNPAVDNNYACESRDSLK
jgi:hypothetical protein